MKYIAVLEQEKKGVAVTFPDFPECVTFGANEEEAVDMAHEALAMFAELQAESGQELPAPMSPDEIRELPETRGNKTISVEVAGDGSDFETVEVTLHGHLLDRIVRYAESYGVDPADFLAVAAREAMRNDVFGQE
ncbi:type II toxin-antitoxin system HicB family antitoxin [Pseudodesulfovibrio tunisiensis]|uniref:type II toxin-antitoxin system HicB family antitoxin n=1 Tax=Pseudodesulfovibrio tunisiensis TaxID=463192 RepID=UPI001FB2384A|nr:type II toxin-antitoxin system HicB family antitoxin [Pseudodesulfovibrio tunisiensis]